MPQKKVLVTRPDYDTPTNFISHAAQEVVDCANSHGHDVLEIRGPDVIKKEVEGRIKKKNPKLVLINGHGDSNSLMGHEDEPIIALEDNHKILKSKITYALACGSAENLGRACGKFKNTAYIGYRGRFMFGSDKHSTSATPGKDAIAKDFLEAANCVSISLIKGNTVRDAYNKSQEAFAEKVRYYMRQESADSTEIAMWLMLDRQRQVCCGNDKLTV